MRPCFSAYTTPKKDSLASFSELACQAVKYIGHRKLQSRTSFHWRAADVSADRRKGTACMCTAQKEQGWTCARE